MKPQDQITDDVLPAVTAGIEAALALDPEEIAAVVQRVVLSAKFAPEAQEKGPGLITPRVQSAVAGASIHIGADGGLSVRYRNRQAGGDARLLEMGATWHNPVLVGPEILRAVGGTFGRGI